MDLSGGEYEEFNCADETDFSDIVHYSNYPVCHVQESSECFVSAFCPIDESLDVLDALLSCVDLDFRQSLIINGLEAENNTSVVLPAGSLGFSIPFPIEYPLPFPRRFFFLRARK